MIEIARMRWLESLFICLQTLSGADWIRIGSANFDLYTTSTEREGRRALETFELTAIS